MKPPDLPPDEEERIDALRSLRLLDTLPERAYDDLTRLAAYVCRTPIALVSLVDENRQWFKSRFGLDAPETPRAISFCGHVVASGEAMQVCDPRADPRFDDNPLVTGSPHIRFYAGTPIAAPSGHLIGTLCVIDRVPRALTEEQHEMIAALGRQVEQLLDLRMAAEREILARSYQQRFFHMSLEMLCIAGFDGYFKHLNPSWQQVLGYTMDELLARPFIEFVHPDDREATLAEAARLFAGDYETISFENRYRHRDGSYRWLSWSSRAHTEDQLLLAVAHDITANRRAVAALRAARDAANRASRAKSAFLANMSHELRTPLNAVIGFANVLGKNTAGNQSPQDLVYLERIVANGRHLLSLLGDILDLSKIEVGHQELTVELVDLGAVVAEVVDQLEGQASDAGVEIAVEIPARVAPLEADVLRVKQVVINLVGNAIKFTRAGRVLVRLRTKPDGVTPQRLDVVDTGIGIEPDKLDAIFDAFQQADTGTSRRFGGTGLGLTIARSLSQMMGFELLAASTPGAGSTFSVLLSDSAVPPVHVPLDEAEP